MRIVIAQRDLAQLGGSQTFVLTIAEHLARLGHNVTVYALELGLAAELGRARAIEIVGAAGLPDGAVEATISLDSAMAIDMARRYPSAVRLYAMHHSDEVWRPPAAPGIVAATVAPNERLMTVARGCAGAGEVVRIKQPIDLSRFTPRGCWPRETPRRILLIGNYFQTPAQRVDQLRAAWSAPGLKWRQIGHPHPSTAVAEAMAEADIVVGYGRSILEAMACGRPAYVHEHSGSDGWVTAESYARMEGDGFSGMAVRAPPSLDQLRKDFALYAPALGHVGRDFSRGHDARLVAAELVALINRLGKPENQHDPIALKALSALAESRYRADLDISALRYEVRTLRSKLRRRRTPRRIGRLFSRLGSRARAWFRSLRTRPGPRPRREVEQTSGGLEARRED